MDLLKRRTIDLLFSGNASGNLEKGVLIMSIICEGLRSVNYCAVWNVVISD